MNMSREWNQIRCNRDNEDIKNTLLSIDINKQRYIVSQKYCVLVCNTCENIGFARVNWTTKLLNLYKVEVDVHMCNT